MKLYIKDNNIYWLDEPLADADAEQEINAVQEEILRNGGTAEWRDGVIKIIPKAAEIAEKIQSIGLTKLEFMQRFTDTELATLYTVAKTNVAVEVWFAKFNATTPDDNGYSIYLDDQRTIDSVYMLEQAGLLAIGRAVEVLS
jgi:hypothetical protein